ncbi:unnamed protein product [Rhizophagus irregularis]|nr:unnamed protein product [Rhizophagus irregularis]
MMLFSKRGRKSKEHSKQKAAVIQNNIVYTKLLEKSHFPTDVPKIYAEHHIPSSDSTLYDPTLIPHTQPNLITPCPGCDLHDFFYIRDICPRYVISYPSNNTITIHANLYKKNNNRFNNIFKVHKSHSELYADDFIDYNLRNNPNSRSIDIVK